MKTTQISVLISILAILFFSCTKDDQRGFPSVTTLSDAEVLNDGAIIHATVSYENVAEIIDHGVTYYMTRNINDETSYEKISQGPLTTNSFSVLIERNLVKNAEYTAKAFVVTKEKTVYGNEITFISKGGKAPIINSFWPEKAYAGDTLIIRGKYFSNKNELNKVKFSNQSAEVFYSTDSLLKVIVPVLIESVTAIIRLEVGDFIIQANKNFELSEPTIDSLFPERIMPGEVFFIKGKGLNTVNTVYKLNYIPGDYKYFSIKSSSDTLIEVLTYNSDMTGIFDINIQQLDKEINSGKKLTIYLPEITSVSPTTVWFESIIEIKGTDLSKINWLFTGNDELEIISKTDNLIKAKVITPFVNSNIRGMLLNAREIYFDSQLLQFRAPVITSVTPLSATYGETLTITGDYFIPGLSTNANGANTSFDYISRNKLTYPISWFLPAGPQSLSLSYIGNTFSKSTLDFIIPKIQIASITPTEIKNGTEIFIKFENLPPSITIDKVTRCWLERNPMFISDVSSEGIKVIVNETFDCPEYPSITLDIGQQTVTGDRLLHLNQPWKQFTFLEIPSYQNYTLCSTFDQSDNTLYAIAHPEYNNNIRTGILYKYSPEFNKWDKLSYMSYFDFESPARIFSTGDELLVVGYNFSTLVWNVCKYSKSTKTWKRLKGIPDNSANAVFGGNLFTMVVNNRIFIGKRDWLYEYDEANNVWLSRTKIPAGREILSPVVMNYNSKILLGFPAYYTSAEEVGLLYEYDPQTDKWKDHGEFENTFFYNTSGGSYVTSYNNKFYITGNSQITGSAKLVEFDPTTLKSKEMIVPVDKPSGAFLIFQYNNFLYLGTHKDSFYKIPVSDFPEIEIDE